MAFGKLFGLAAIGGLLYAHKRHGGQFTVESFTKSARDLMEGATTRARDFKSMAETRLHRTTNRLDDAMDVQPVSNPDFGATGQSYGTPKPDKGY